MYINWNIKVFGITVKTLRKNKENKLRTLRSLQSENLKIKENIRYVNFLK